MSPNVPAEETISAPPDWKARGSLVFKSCTGSRTSTVTGTGASCLPSTSNKEFGAGWELPVAVGWGEVPLSGECSDAEAARVVGRESPSGPLPWLGPAHAEAAMMVAITRMPPQRRE